ncbi:DUF5710 domain-containing protein [Paraburkholderia sp. C35]|uniref:DUF5710 domain-containing protein n=1 Tax=Paraburkholderia sp. C35 TaxID=2126993 RepID=UPI000D694C05|nr:DUF5710 domain-containing protein [Paraburkholderia sp. C35]
MSMIALNVPYSEKDQAKRLGAQWDPVAREWKIDSGKLIDWKRRVVREPFQRWLYGNPVGFVDRFERDWLRGIEAAKEKARIDGERQAWASRAPRATTPEGVLRLMGFTTFRPYRTGVYDENWRFEHWEWCFNDEKHLCYCDDRDDGPIWRSARQNCPFVSQAEQDLVLDAVVRHGWTGYGA